MSTFASVVRIGTLASFILLAGPAAHAAPPTKEECVDAHSKGQDAREAGQFAQASKLFLMCAQPSCPELVRGDCARFADEIERQKASVSFAARDSAQADLPDTTVYVDGKLVASQLGDGKAHEIDPGRHEVRFVHAGKETILNVVVNQGEKGRTLVGTFSSASGSTSTADPGATPVTTPDASGPRRPMTPLILVGVGAAAMIAGGVLVGLGFSKIPGNCSLSTHECAAPPADPVFASASSGVKMVNIGSVVGGVGALTLGGSLIWYFAQPTRPAAKVTPALVPWIGPQGAGLSFSSAL